MENIPQMPLNILGGVLGFVKGDFDNDGYTDIAYSENDKVYVLRGPSFAAPQKETFAVQWNGAMGYVQSLAVMDFDQDGRDDLVVGVQDGPITEKTQAKIQVFLNTPFGSGPPIFTSPVESAQFPIGADANQIAVGDLDGDGLEDIVVATRQQMAYVLLNQSQ